MYLFKTMKMRNAFSKQQIHLPSDGIALAERKTFRLVKSGDSNNGTNVELQLKLH
jgi:hypothetical protein